LIKAIVTAEKRQSAKKEAVKPLQYTRQRNASQLKIKSHVNVTAATNKVRQRCNMFEAALSTPRSRLEMVACGKHA